MKHKALVVGIIFLCFCVESSAKYSSYIHSSSGRHRYVIQKPSPVYFYNNIIYHSRTHEKIGEVPKNIDSNCASRVIDAYPNPVVCVSELSKRKWSNNLIFYTETNSLVSTVRFTETYTWDIGNAKKSQIEESKWLRNSLVGLIIIFLFGWCEERFF